MGTSFRNLILWRNVQLSAAVFTSGLLILLALSFYSAIVVVTCLAIPIVFLTVAIRALFSAKCALLKQPSHNPFQYWLNEGWEIGSDRMDSINRRVADTTNVIVLEMKRVALVEDFVDSIRGLIFLYAWYYIGRNISGLTLLFLGYWKLFECLSEVRSNSSKGFIGTFTIPKIYDLYRREIDNGIKQIRIKYENFYARIVDNIPGNNSSNKKKSSSNNGTSNGVHKTKEEQVENNKDKEVKEVKEQKQE